MNISLSIKFRLRAWTRNDLPSLVKYANNQEVSKNLTDKFPYPYKKEDGLRFLEMVAKNDPQSVFAIEINDEAAGAIGLHPQDDIHCKNAELGYWLAQPYWGKGIITEAIKQIVAYGFQNFDINRIFARPFGSNTASQRVLEKAGFKLEATFKKTIFKREVYEDELYYAFRKNEN